MIQVYTELGADLSIEYQNQYQINIFTPDNVNSTYLNRKNRLAYPTPKSIYEQLSASNALLITQSSQVSKVSTIASEAKKRLKLENLTIFESKSSSIVTGLLSILATQLIELNSDLKEIKEILQKIEKEIYFIAISRDLTQLYAKGHIGFGSYWISKVYPMKFLFELKKGEFATPQNIFSDSALIKKLISQLKQKKLPTKNLSVFSIGEYNFKAFKKIKEMLKLRFNINDFFALGRTSSFEYNFGKKTLALAFIPYFNSIEEYF